MIERDWRFGEDLRLRPAREGEPWDSASARTDLPEECLETILGLNLDTWIPGWPIRLQSLSMRSLYGGADITGTDDFGCTHIFELKKDVNATGVDEVVPQGMVYMLNHASEMPGPQAVEPMQIARRVAGFWLQRRLNEQDTDSAGWQNVAEAHAARIAARHTPQQLAQRRTHLHLVVPGISSLVAKGGYGPAIPYYDRYVPISAWDPRLEIVPDTRQGRLRVAYVPILTAEGDQADESARLIANMAFFEPPIRTHGWRRFVAHRPLSNTWSGRVRSMRVVLAGVNVDVLVYGPERRACVHCWYDGESEANASKLKDWQVQCAAIERTDVELELRHSSSWQTADASVLWSERSEETGARLLAKALGKLIDALAR